MKTEIIHFLATDSIALTGFLFEPTEKTNRIAIFLHGNGNSSALSSLSLSEEMINELHKERCAYLTFNNRGAGYMAKLHNAEIGKKVWAGTAYEKIEECVADIDGAISFAASRGYTDITLIGLSSGANKACVYCYLKPAHSLNGVVLLAGGDDAALYRQWFGEEFVQKLADQAHTTEESGAGADLVPELAEKNNVMSYQSFYDIVNPDGLYNTFPFDEALGAKRFGTKELFREFSSITVPLCVLYGERDELCMYGAEKTLATLATFKPQSDTAEYYTIEGAEHSFGGYEREVGSRIANFIANHT